MAQIIDGKKLAQEYAQRTAQEAEELKKKGVTPGLTVVLVGENPASQVYVRNKEKACKKAGIDSQVHRLPDTTSEGELLELIHRLNQDQSVHGILVQLPLPKHIDQMRVIEAIDPAKDVDGFHPINTGRLVLGLPCFAPCTPSGIMALIDAAGVDPAGKRACVVGRSNIVGKPVAIMLLARHATVTVCHSKTPDLDKEVGRADIVVAAIGRPRFVQGSWIKPGAVVIDVGISRTESGLAGDVDFEETSKRALAITPVPGGVGPMTIAMLLRNTVEAAKRTLVR